MKSKILMLLLVIGVLIPLASAANEPVITNTTFCTDHVHLDWDDVPSATHYNVYLTLPSTYHTNNTSIVLDGNIDPIMEDSAFQAVLFSPNPLISDTLDTFYSLKNDTTIFFEANTYDSDIGTYEDWVGVYIDFDGDGLTSDDRHYRIEEDGTVTREQWNGVSWVVQPGSAAQGVVAGGGTTNPTYNLFIPQTEIQFTNGSLNKVVVERSHLTDGIRSYSYVPNNGNPEDESTYTDLWVFGNKSDSDYYLYNVSDSDTIITGLTPFDWIECGVSSVVAAVESDITYTSGITECVDYTVNGYVYDDSTGEPLRNTLVILEDSFITDVQVTNNTGYFEFEHVINDSYMAESVKDNYINGSVDFIVAGDNVTLEILSSPGGVNQIPLMLLLFIMLIDIGCIVIAFTNDEEIGTFTVFCAFMATVLSFVISKILINGQLVESFEFTSTIQNAAFGYIFQYMAIVMGIMTAITFVLYVQERIIKEVE